MQDLIERIKEEISAKREMLWHRENEVNILTKELAELGEALKILEKEVKK